MRSRMNQHNHTTLMPVSPAGLCRRVDLLAVTGKRRLVAVGLLCALYLIPAKAQQAAPADNLGQTAVDQAQSELRLSTDEMNAARESVRQSERRAAEIADEIADLERQTDGLTQKLLEANQAAQSLEASVEVIETRLASLAGTEADLRANLLGRRDQLGTVLAALQRLGNNPPPTLIVKPENALSALRSAILLAAVVPEMRTEMEALAADLAALQQTKDQIGREQQRLNDTLAALEQDNSEIDRLIAARRQLLDQRNSDLRSEQQRAEQLAEQATSLQALVATLEQQLQEAERTASEPAAPVLPSSQPRQPAVPFAETTGQLKLPVRGAVLTRFGETDRFGADSKGMTLATRPGARVSTPIDGKVVYAGPFRSFGSVVILDVGGGYHILLAGMEQVDISLGQEILLGEPIGAMGSRRFASISSQGTGLSQPLLYIEFWHNDKPIDSSPWWTTSISKGG